MLALPLPLLSRRPCSPRAWPSHLAPTAQSQDHLQPHSYSPHPQGCTLGAGILTIGAPTGGCWSFSSRAWVSPKGQLGGPAGAAGLRGPQGRG